MKWYELLKVVHFMGLISLTGAFIIYPRVGQRLRKATTLAEVRSWLCFLEIARGMFRSGATMMALSGLAMTWMRWRAPYAFVVVGMLGLIFIAATFDLVVSRHLGAMRAVAGHEAGGSGAVSAELFTVISQPRPWIVLFALNISAIGVLFEMTLKLGYLGGVALPLAGAVIGTVAGAAMLRNERRPQGVIS
jgi:hypothetical protein